MVNLTLQGTKGVYESPRMGGPHQVSFSDGSGVENMRWRPLSEYSDFLPERYRLEAEKGAAAGHGGGDYFIVRDFIDAVKGVKPPFIDVYEACEWTAVGLLSALSVSNRGRAMDMPDFRSKRVKDKAVKL